MQEIILALCFVSFGLSKVVNSELLQAITDNKLEMKFNKVSVDQKIAKQCETIWFL